MQELEPHSEALMQLRSMIDGMDIYLIDQILKGRLHMDHHILDAGCGGGRNLKWFLEHGHKISALDRDADCIERLSKEHPESRESFHVGDLSSMPYADGTFDYVISSAVLHFAQSVPHFWRLLEEHWRILRPGGTFFVRMASDIGIKHFCQPVSEGIYRIPDGSTRFLLTRSILLEWSNRFGFEWIERFKTTNVDDIRCMSTLVVRKR